MMIQKWIKMYWSFRLSCFNIKSYNEKYTREFKQLTINFPIPEKEQEDMKLSETITDYFTQK
ncbi:hypothetical protein B5F14_09765 [Faecalitalea cylindroides]|uniref:Uncharacterized protein n=1 Tax=Faecalitalea cylindroides TaxID=39483 RepID=A0A1Y4LKA7_9FIRM|nr:hypothetical protein B5F14_09765 [Faecalitalea cylindroides]